MDQSGLDSIESSGYPLAFKVAPAEQQSVVLTGAGTDTLRVEARQMAGHQKEAVVTEGETGAVWRLTSDEGGHLKGTDLAPFPLGFFNAGLQGDLYRRLRDFAHQRDIVLDEVNIRLVNHYWLTGSFVQGTGEGHAEAPDLDVHIRSGVDRTTVSTLVQDAIQSSPAFALLGAAIENSTFALYVNGRRRNVPGVLASQGDDARDPYRTYASAPRPSEAGGGVEIITKTGEQEQGATQLASPSPGGKLIRNIFGVGRAVENGAPLYVDTWLGLPGSSHFRFVTDEGSTETAPSGLALMSAGIAFCYMTQLSRYIENMKLKIRSVRLVQHNPYTTGPTASAGPVDTHLFLDGEAPEEIHANLLMIAARTCYLHAACKTPLRPNTRLVHNGQDIAQAA